MAFVRFGVDGSQVYIFENRDLAKECCGCRLTPRDERGELLGEHFTTSDLDAMLAHVAAHRAAGHVVPDWVDQALRDEWEDA